MAGRRRDCCTKCLPVEHCPCRTALNFNLGGSLEMLQNPVAIVEMAVDKKANTVLMPVSARRALNDLPDEYWTKTNVEFYSEPSDAVFKALVE